MNRPEANYFYVNRELLNSDRWLSEPFTRGQAWVDLFGLAQHTEGFFRVRGIRVNVERGQLAYSQVTLAKRWQWSRDKVRRYLNELETHEDIIQQNNAITTLITIVKYEKWQGSNTTDNTTEKKEKKAYLTTDKNKKEPISAKTTENSANPSSIRDQSVFSKKNPKNDTAEVSAVIKENDLNCSVEKHQAIQQAIQQTNIRKTSDDTHTKNDNNDKNDNIPATQGVAIDIDSLDALLESENPIPRASKESSDYYFSLFWKIYKKRVGRKEALKAWEKIKPELYDNILIALGEHNKQESWAKEDGQFIPHPATWLNKERWNDEIKTKPKRTAY